MTEAIPAMDGTILEVRNLTKHFPIKRGLLKRTVGMVKAVDDVSFDIRTGETLGLVGESGCGKTTTSRCLLRAIEPTSGEIMFRTAEGNEVNVATLPNREMRPLRREMQMVFQDPFSSLNSRMSLLDIVGEPLLVHGMTNRQERQDRVAELLRLVGLRPEYMQRYPHAFSGGERQRIGIARALALHPRLVVADEPVSALDVSVQAQVINLLMDLQSEFELTYLFRRPRPERREADKRPGGRHVRGQDCGDGECTEELFANPKHPYTEALLAAVPVPDPRARRQDRRLLQGEVANPANPPSGCYFHPRCPYVQDVCRTETPSLQEVSPGHYASCHRVQELELAGISQVS